MPTRETFEGEMCVYRDGHIKQHLAAKVLLDDNTLLYYYPAPKCFDALITDGRRNVARVSFVADHDTGKNPRNATLVDQPRPPR